MAEPSPVKKACDGCNAPSGKLKARAGLKCEMPATITHSTVAITPAERSLDSFPITEIRLYKRTTATPQHAIATNVAKLMGTRSSNFPTSGNSQEKVWSK